MNKEIVGTPLRLRVRPNGVRKPTPKSIHIGPGTLGMMTARFAGLLQHLFSVSKAHTMRVGSSDVSNGAPFPSLSIKNHVRPSAFTKASIKSFNLTCKTNVMPVFNVFVDDKACLGETCTRVLVPGS